jgi:large subunit ribosomal protein L35
MGKGPKTKKSILKRFKITGTGKLMVKKVSGHRHLASSKSSKQRRQAGKQPILGATQAGRIKKMIGI